MNQTRILFIASECQPFCNTGGLGEVVGSLPKALVDEGADVRVVLPYYRDVARDFHDQVTFVGSITVQLAWRQQYCGVFTLARDGVTYYFVDNQYYFNREGLYGAFDDAERFAFFSRAALDILPMVGFAPDVVHCHDWQTALVPVYLRSRYHDYPDYKGIKTVFTVHNIEYQGKFDRRIAGDVLGLDGWQGNLVEYDGCVNFMKGGMVCCDILSTVSPAYAREIHYDYFAHGLTEIIQSNTGKVRGILNGINTRLYDPETDAALLAHYTAEDMSGKAENKRALQELCNLNVQPEVPVLAIISRLAPHKGMDLFTCVLEEILAENIQVVVLGQGERKYEDYFNYLGAHYSGKMSAMITYNNDLSRKIYAGADIFLMPSKAEPCGLAQMIASRYGTVPVVRNIGGLSDTIRDYGDNGNGFVFESYNAHDMLDAVRRALSVYHNQPEWKALAQKAMRQDFSWKRSAQTYMKLYRQLGERE